MKELDVKELFDIVNEFTKVHKKEKEKLPFHINLLDELWAKENAHSRILAKLIQYKEDGKFIFLKDFIHNICGFQNIDIDTLIVQKVDSCGNIDIPIYNNEHFIIIENKINGADEQNSDKGGQIAKYIDRVISTYGRKKENIYVIYTPNWQQEPSEDIWINKDKHNYIKEFKSRYKSVSYRSDIYPWIKEKILPQIRVKDIYLHSALLQYIDYLEGRFGLRKIEKNMNMKLQEEIKKNLNLNEQDLETSIKILSEKEEELTNLIVQINSLKYSLKKDYYLNLFKGWKEKLQNDFPTLNSNIVSDNFKIKEDIINRGVKFSISEKEYAIILEYNRVSEKMYIGIIGIGKVIGVVGNILKV